MKWLRYAHAGQVGFGVLEGDTVHLHRGDLFGEHEATGEHLALDAVDLLPPCEPRTVVGLWNNFHALAQKNGWTPPAEPLYFLKAPGSLAGPGSTTPAAPESVGRVAFEGELAIVIGKPTHRSAIYREGVGHASRKVDEKSIVVSCNFYDAGGGGAAHGDDPVDIGRIVICHGKFLGIEAGALVWHKPAERTRNLDPRSRAPRPGSWRCSVEA